MLIVCPSCASEYAIDPDRIGEAGRKVRCAVCRATWFVDKPDPAQAGGQPGSLNRAAVTTSGRGETIEGTAQPAITRPQSGSAQELWRTNPRRPKRLRRPADWAAVTFLVAMAVTIPSALAVRREVVRVVPASASLFEAVGLDVNLIGLDLAEVAASHVVDSGVKVLAVEGQIRSRSGRPVAVPRLEFTISGEDGAALYSWSTKPPIPELGPGETARFTARLASPPPAGRRLVATFQGPRDDQAVALR
jgi:predicted Zn finger-like uncharacterized protein